MKKVIHGVVVALVAIPCCAYALGFTQACMRFIGHSMGPMDWSVVGIERMEAWESKNVLNILRWEGFRCYVKYFADKGWAYNLTVITERVTRDVADAYLEAEAERVKCEDDSLNSNLKRALAQSVRQGGQFGGWSHLKKADDWLKQ